MNASDNAQASGGSNGCGGTISGNIGIAVISTFALFVLVRKKQDGDDVSAE